MFCLTTLIPHSNRSQYHASTAVWLHCEVSLTETSSAEVKYTRKQDGSEMSLRGRGSTDGPTDLRINPSWRTH